MESHLDELQFDKPEPVQGKFKFIQDKVDNVSTYEP